MSPELTNARAFIGQTVEVTIDRPLGSAHPERGFTYPVNYGFIPNSLAPDGEELDAYILGIFEPLENFTGQCIAVIHRLDDNDDKLVV
ncbi:MAG: inorganic diphosphatase, partial [Chloroflexi bacterium]|nr:inorganic diphosphatase [Chloroflexota bacterium]